MNDQDIIALYFDRNEQAIRETADKYGQTCLQASMNILNSYPDAEECLNDTYLKTWNAIPPTKPHSLGAFVLRIVRNLSLNRLRDLRRQRRNRELTLSFDELEDCISLPDTDSGELAELLSDFVSRQRETDRVLFMGRYWFACPIQDLARRMNMTPNAVRQRLHKTRERLRSYLEERGYRV